jgi:hypothetical protein
MRNWQVSPEQLKKNYEKHWIIKPIYCLSLPPFKAPFSPFKLVWHGDSAGSYGRWVSLWTNNFSSVTSKSKQANKIALKLSFFHFPHSSPTFNDPNKPTKSHYKLFFFHLSDPVAFGQSSLTHMMVHFFRILWPNPFRFFNIFFVTTIQSKRIEVI